MSKRRRALEAPGIRLIQDGRIVQMQTDRTPEQHRELLEEWARLHNEMPQRVEEKAGQLRAELARYETFDILAQLALHEQWLNPETYKEWAHEGRQAYVEYATLLALQDEYHETGDPLIDADKLSRVRSLIDGVFRDTVFYHVSESADPERNGPPSDLEFIRFRTLLYNLMVRNPGYQQHLEEVLRGLFTSGAAAEWMVTTLGFSIEQALAMNEAAERIGGRRLADRIRQSKEQGKQITQAVRRMRKGKPRPEDRDGHLGDILGEMARMSEKKLLRARKRMMIGWSFIRLGETVSFNAEELASEAVVPPGVATAYLKARCIEFGSIPAGAAMPASASPLQARPIIHHAGRYMVPTPSWLGWGLRTFIEDALNPGKPGSLNRDKRLWERYEKARARYLEESSLDQLQRALPHAKLYRNLSYTVTEDSLEKRPELDGLIQLDRAVLLVEAKAGTLTTPALEGRRLRLKEDLKKLLADAHRQGLRAKEYIAASERPVFVTGTGETIEIDKQQVDDVFMIAVTLQPMEIYTSALHEIAKLGIFQEGELPWAVSYLELRVVCDVLEEPAQLIHFILRRSRLNEIKRVIASDELDYFSHYLLDGLYFEDVPAEVDQVSLASHTSDFDDYYHHQQGIRETPAEVPRQPMPPLLRAILNDLEEHHPAGYLVGALAILDMSWDTRQTFNKLLDKAQRLALKDGRIHDCTIVVSGPRRTGITVMVSGGKDLRRLIVQLETYTTIKKHELQSDRWVAIGSMAKGTGIVHAYAALTNPWTRDPAMDAAVDEFKRELQRTNPKR